MPQSEQSRFCTLHRPQTDALRKCAEARGLMSYGANIVDVYGRAGIHAGRIRKGHKAAGIAGGAAKQARAAHKPPQSARMLGLVVPSSLLAIDDAVIE